MRPQAASACSSVRSRMRGARVLGTTSTEDKAQLARTAGADEIIFYMEQTSRPRPGTSPADRESGSSTMA
jgi:hypothetical protein